MTNFSYQGYNSYYSQQTYNYQWEGTNTTPFGHIHDVDLPYTNSWHWEVPPNLYSGSYTTGNYYDSSYGMNSYGNCELMQQLMQFFCGGASAYAQAGNASAYAQAGNGQAQAYAQAGNGSAFAFAASGNSFAFAGAVSGSGSSYCPYPSQPVAANETGKIWGDPHFVGGDGGKYDVQGQAGKTYNLLSDRGLQFNGTFGAWGNGGATVVKDTSINVAGPYGQSQVKFGGDGKASVNGQQLQDGQTVRLADGGTATLKGNKLTVKTAEGYEIVQENKGGYINADVKTGANGVAADGVMPHGLLGQTFDADNKARNGKTGAGAQGEGAIDGNVRDYEVNGLNDFSGRSPGQTNPNNQYPPQQQNIMQMFMMFMMMILGMFGMQGQQRYN